MARIEYNADCSTVKDSSVVAVQIFDQKKFKRKVRAITIDAVPCIDGVGEGDS